MECALSGSPSHEEVRISPASSHPRSRSQAAWTWAQAFAGYALLLTLILLLPARNFLPADRLYVDVVTSFAPQFATLALFMAVLLAWRRRWLRASAFALLLMPDLVSAVGGLGGPETDRTLGRVYAANLSEQPEAVAAAVDELLTLEADLIWLTEFPEDPGEALIARIEALEADYPYGIAWPAADGRSLRFLSRFPVRAREVFNPERAPGRPALRMTLDVRGATLTVFALHTHPPAAGWSLQARNETLAWVAASLRRLQGDAIVVGDLNLSAFAPRFQRFVRAAGLDCASPWTCAVASWPSWLPPLATPIDHVLTRGDLVVENLRRGERTGSDHYPLVADIHYQRRR